MIAESLAITEARFIDGGEDTAKEARTRYKDVFGGRSARRMTHLGILSGLCIRELDISPECPIVYASRFAESRSLEDYIDSFPTASPALFQTSIHPSAVEQALIPEKQSLRQFYPITSDWNMGGRALETAFLMEAAQRIVIGGEERGSWLCEYGLASDKAFCCALQLEAGSSSGVGRVSLDRSEPIENGAPLELPELAIAIRDRVPAQAPSIALNAWIRIEWK